MTEILSVEELNNLSDDELINLYNLYSSQAIIQKNIEQAIKILINSLYGYLGSPYSRFFNVFIAEAITLTGQTIIQTSAKAINDDLIKITGITKDRIVGVDTDSVVGDTIIKVNNKSIKISDYYNSITNDNIIDSSKEIKRVEGDYSISFNGNEIQNKPIKYIMRHKTKKMLYKITVGNDSVIVTEDHSIMVIDTNGKLVEIKPSELNKNKHKIVNIIDTDSKEQLYE